MADELDPGRPAVGSDTPQRGCPDELALAQLADGSAPQDARARLDRHLEGCSSCRERLEEARTDEALLPGLRRAHARPDPHPESSPAGPAQTLEEVEPDLARYRILRRLGAGGMGVVYEAEQRSPRRRVAIKVLRTSSLSERALRRFEHEAAVLARLDHPGIAQIVEAGTFTSHGERQPFFAMELVEGAPLDRWADREGLDLRRRLDLFLRVCDAVEHAHASGVVHRDLKPANLLVNAAGQPKVLDFGVARSFDADCQVTTLLSEAGEIVGTLPYMSPEQLAGDPRAIDARADVHALGVVLYQLLAGRLPIEGGGRSVPELIRWLETAEPRPLGAVRPELEGDLETIVGKALERDKERRYDSAAALAADLERYLNHQPISARPPSALYHLGRFARRNRSVVGALSLTFLALVAGLAATSWQAARASQAELEARAEAAALEELNGFLQALIGFDPDDPLGVVRGGDTTLREIVADADRRLNEAPLGDPRSEARIRIALGNFWRRLGELDRAGIDLEQALELRRAAFAPDAVELAEALNTVGVNRFERGLLDAAEEAMREALAVYALGGHEDDARVATTHSNLANLLGHRGDTVEAERFARRALEMHLETLGRDSLHVVNDLSSVAVYVERQGGDDEALELLREAYDISLRIDPDAEHPWSGLAAQKLGTLLHAIGALEEAERVMREALELGRGQLAVDPSDLTERRLRLASILRDLGRPGEGEALAREVLAESRGRQDRRGDVARALFVAGDCAAGAEEWERAVELLGEAEGMLAGGAGADALLAAVRATLGRALLGSGRAPAAGPVLEQAVQGFSSVPDHEDWSREAGACFDLAGLRHAAGRGGEATESLRQGLGALERSAARGREPDARLWLAGRAALARTLAEGGEVEEALTLARASWERLGESGLGAGDAVRSGRELVAAALACGEPELAAGWLDELDGSACDDAVQRVGLLADRARLCRLRDRADEAAALCLQVADLGRELHPEGSDEQLATLDGAARCLLELGRAQAAAELLDEALTLAGTELPGDEPSARRMVDLARAQVVLGRFAQAEALLLDCLAGVESFAPDDRPIAREALAAAVELYERWDRPERAEPFRERLP